MDGKLVLDSGPEIAYPNDQQQAKTKGLITFVPRFDNTVCFVRTIRHYSDVNQFCSDSLDNGPPFCRIAAGGPR